MLAIGWDWRADRERVSEMRGEWIDAGKNKTDSTKPVVLYLHGGAYYLCSYKMYRPLLSKIAKVKESH
ncbi:hypothetical protein BCR43DRAFT_484895 [Syncephalastrum racemosum]|uniref:Alpha/beta hydrolase fold-3 domain-containing protein n=1 Tax=Syncephalastrum racemosum TaxID=13706 RepID=A0A1X2HLP8_SYNRA|nr:hypothetical protein BCR43DRAFT_484895 [Syncephalastrum racemosum]